MSDFSLSPPGDPMDPSCQMISGALSDYIEEQLSDNARLKLEEHLKMCPLCLVYLAQFRDVYKLSGAPQEEQLPADFQKVMGKVIRAWKSELQEEE